MRSISLSNIDRTREKPMESSLLRQCRRAKRLSPVPRSLGASCLGRTHNPCLNNCTLPVYRTGSLVAPPASPRWAQSTCPSVHMSSPWRGRSWPSWLKLAQATKLAGAIEGGCSSRTQRHLVASSHTTAPRKSTSPVPPPHKAAAGVWAPETPFQEVRHKTATTK